jgi:hypothetical protein
MPVTFPTRTVAVIAATAAAGLSGAVIAGAASSGSAPSGSATQQRDHDGRGPGGPGGPDGHRHGPHADLTGVAAALGVSEAKLRSALDAARPDRGARDGFAAAIAKQLGVATADVQAVLDANKPSRDRDADGPRGDRGARRDGARPDDSALAAALAKKLSITEAKAQAALDAVRTAHDADEAGERDDFYAAVAKALGKDTSAVKQAFEAERP